MRVYYPSELQKLDFDGPCCILVHTKGLAIRVVELL